MPLMGGPQTFSAPHHPSCLRVSARGMLSNGASSPLAPQPTQGTAAPSCSSPWSCSPNSSRPRGARARSQSRSPHLGKPWSRASERAEGGRGWCLEDLWGRGQDPHPPTQDSSSLPSLRFPCPLPVGSSTSLSFWPAHHCLHAQGVEGNGQRQQRQEQGSQEA